MTSGHELYEIPHGNSNTATKHCRQGMRQRLPLLDALVETLNVG
jgi:hypothetical protein